MKPVQRKCRVIGEINMVLSLGAIVGLGFFTGASTAQSHH